MAKGSTGGKGYAGSPSARGYAGLGKGYGNSPTGNGYLGSPSGRGYQGLPTGRGYEGRGYGSSPTGNNLAQNNPTAAYLNNMMSQYARNGQQQLANYLGQQNSGIPGNGYGPQDGLANSLQQLSSQLGGGPIVLLYMPPGNSGRLTIESMDGLDYMPPGMPGRSSIDSMDEDELGHDPAARRLLQEIEGLQASFGVNQQTASRYAMDLNNLESKGYQNIGSLLKSFYGDMKKADSKNSSMYGNLERIAQDHESSEASFQEAA